MTGWPKPLVCDLCGNEASSLAQYATGWGGVFEGGLYGLWVCDHCAPQGSSPISMVATVRTPA